MASEMEKLTRRILNVPPAEADDPVCHCGMTLSQHSELTANHDFKELPGSVETCSTVFPSVEIGTYQQPKDLVIPLFVYATITRRDGVEWRAAYGQRCYGGRVGRVHVDANGKREWL